MPRPGAPRRDPVDEGADGGVDEDVARLYAGHRLSLVRLALLLVDDLGVAEEVVHDAFAGLVARGRLRHPAAAVGYLRTAVVNRSRSVLRRRRTVRAHGPQRSLAPTDPADHAVLAEEHREVLAALDTLAPRQREVLVLRYWEGLSEAEIATTLGISPGTVKSTASRALRALEAILEEQR